MRPTVGSRTRWTRFWVPVVALVAVLASGAWLVTQQSNLNNGWQGWGFASDSWGGMGPGDGRMMGGSGYGWLPGDGERVGDLTQARARASQYAETLASDLEVGEVMEFSNHYYAELQAPDGTKATEVIVDPNNGAVQLEFGPARMWNTRFGMMGGGISTTREITATQASATAAEWLTDRDRGLTVEEAEAFPGYYTLHTLRDREIEGMLSVNAATGDVWYHSWHGEYQGMSEGS